MSQFEVGVSAVIFDEHERVLLAHRRDMDLWDLPGGGVEPGELPTEGVIRETKEETGLDVEVERLFIVGVAPEPLLGFVFFCRSSGGTRTTSDESDAVEFFAKDDLPTNLSPRKRAIIETAYEHPSDILYRHVELPPAQQWLDEQGKRS